MERYYSPLRYPGGKAVLADLLGEVLRTNALQNGAYAEPFAGGAGAALELLFKERVWDIYINDADYHVYSFWSSVRRYPEQFCEEIFRVPLTVEEWRRQKGVFDNPQNHNEFEVGFSAFYLNRTNRSGILDGGPIGGLDQSGKWKIDARFNRSGLAERIDRIRRFRDRIHVTNLEALTFLDKVVKPLEGPTLVYLDPPYYKMGAELYLNFYKPADHKRLSEYLKNEIRHPWMLSYDDVPEIRSLYEGVAQRDLSIQYSANSPKKGREVLYFGLGVTNIPLAV